MPTKTLDLTTTTTFAFRAECKHTTPSCAVMMVTYDLKSNINYRATISVCSLIASRLLLTLAMLKGPFDFGGLGCFLSQFKCCKPNS